MNTPIKPEMISLFCNCLVCSVWLTQKKPVPTPRTSAFRPKTGNDESEQRPILMSDGYLTPVEVQGEKTQETVCAKRERNPIEQQHEYTYIDAQDLQPMNIRPNSVINTAITSPSNSQRGLSIHETPTVGAGVMLQNRPPDPATNFWNGSNAVPVMANANGMIPSPPWTTYQTTSYSSPVLYSTPAGYYKVEPTNKPPGSTNPFNLQVRTENDLTVIPVRFKRAKFDIGEKKFKEWKCLIEYYKKHNLPDLEIKLKEEIK